MLNVIYLSIYLWHNLVSSDDEFCHNKYKELLFKIQANVPYYKNDRISHSDIILSYT